MIWHAAMMSRSLAALVGEARTRVARLSNAVFRRHRASPRSRGLQGGTLLEVAFALTVPLLLPIVVVTATGLESPVRSTA